MRKASLCISIVIALSPRAGHADVAAAKAQARAGQFDAMTEIGCAQEQGQPMGRCEAQAALAGDATAVKVTFDNGFARTLLFSNKAFLRGDATMSGTGKDTDWHIAQGFYFVRVDDQRFEIPETLVTGALSRD
ncbi:hypothetical protein [Sulfitobacter sp. S190]|uniref:hypothetical protein n=1 Tax=Sulfitobacter sp. S190 TaxID=2867022 RepID=UPI0021A344B8|nr:hypothetical protein [Sulfitobacter sp. S190]UWR21169.1 hypothetical protein K3756_10595 [Sulfitobacter sp. S190]